MAAVSGGLLSIGAFSRASQLSIKTLRAYHEAGILVPARVDQHTGYRTFHASQLPDAAVILRLRSLDLPLEQVREVVTARDPAVTARILAGHEATMRERLADVTRIVSELQDGLVRPASHTPVHVRHEPHQHTLAVRGRVSEANFAEFLEDAYGRLAAAAERTGIDPSGPTGALYPPEIADDEAEDVEAYLPVARPIGQATGRDGVIVSEVPAARVAVLTHAGGYDAIGDSYRQLGAWVAEHAEHAGRPVREVYVVSYSETADTDRFRTEIHWPINEEESNMTIELANVTFDCADTLAVAQFWSAATGRPIEPEPSEFFAAIGAADGAPGWFFIKVPEPKAAKNRVHVDMVAADREEEVARLVALGATRVADHDEWGHRWTVLQDPEANEFCVAQSPT